MPHERLAGRSRMEKILLRLDAPAVIGTLQRGAAPDGRFWQRPYLEYVRYRERAARLVQEWRRAYARRHEPVPPFQSHITDGIKIPETVRVRAKALALQPERDDHVARRNAGRLAARPHLRQRPRSLLPRARG